jgi:hypothetical protein
MFEDKRSLQVPMTPETGGVLGRGGSQGARQGASVHVVAVGALDQPFIHPMTERLAEVGLLLGVAAVTEKRLLLDQQLPGFLRKMGRMAGNAGHTAICMSGTLKISMFLVLRVARKAAFTNDLRSLPLEHEDFRFVATTANVLGAGAVTCFTTVGFGPLLAF